MNLKITKKRISKPRLITTMIEKKKTDALGYLAKNETPKIKNNKHKITITKITHKGKSLIINIPKNRYMLREFENQGLKLPYACRMGCCTSCAVRLHSGEIYQPEAFGIGKNVKKMGYALMCVGYAKTDCLIEIVDIDEVYDLQFGESFSARALNSENSEYILRDDFALEIATGDE